MGIPHLIATLEHYAVHELLQDETAVIDGPALAYHILYICRSNGVSQPSYDLLGRAAIAWLDGLQSHGVAIQAIYFDGYLPTSKRRVRMERMMKSTSQLSFFFSANPKGCARKHVALKHGLDWDVFKPGKPETRFFSDPSFLVPAIIDALRACPIYQASCVMVPGEADGYCAAHVASRGGIVMTSDSDLLAHDISDGKVVFLRDVHRDANSKLACATFSPRSIYRKLGLPSSVEAWRLAYERKRSIHATLPNILRACCQPVLDEVDYRNFRQQYIHHETASLPPTIKGKSLSLDGLDPRISELLLQLGPGQADSSGSEPNAKISLPILFESPARGNAWEPSTPIRRLAYTVAQRILPCSRPISVQEYRRVQNYDQKGRDISIMSRDMAGVATNELLMLMRRVRAKTRGIMGYYWTLLCLTLDILECEEQGKYSHALYTLQQAAKPSPTPGDRVPWDSIHFVAQLQAGYYSLRILSQVLSIIPEDDLNDVATNLSQIRELLSELPPLAEYPDVEGTLNFLRMANQLRVSQVLIEFVDIPDASVPKADEVRKEAKMKKEIKKQSDTRKAMSANSKAPTRGNIFSLLSAD